MELKLFLMLIGHSFGDYMLQSKEMAIKKSSSIKWCLVHCLIYTTAVVVATWFFHPIFIMGVFVSHFLIDYYELGMKWLRLIRGRDFYKEFYSDDKYRDVALPFATLVYAVVDNTIHITIMTVLLIVLF